MKQLIICNKNTVLNVLGSRDWKEVVLIENNVIEKLHLAACNGRPKNNGSYYSFNFEAWVNCADTPVGNALHIFLLYATCRKCWFRIAPSNNLLSPTDSIILKIINLDLLYGDDIFSLVQFCNFTA